MVLLIAVLSLHFCAVLPRSDSTGPDTERLNRWSHRVAMVGLMVVVSTCDLVKVFYREKICGAMTKKNLVF